MHVNPRNVNFSKVALRIDIISRPY